MRAMEGLAATEDTMYGKDVGARIRENIEPGMSVLTDYKVHVEPIVADMVVLLATGSLVRIVGARDGQPAQDGRPH